MKTRRQRGEGMVSYVIVVAFVVLACLAAAKGLGTSIKGLLSETSSTIDNVKGQIPATIN